MIQNVDNEILEKCEIEVKKKFKPWDLESEMYKKIVAVITDKDCLCEGKSSSDMAAFLLSLDGMLNAVANGKKLHLESKNEIMYKLKASYDVASKVTSIIQKEMDVLVSSDCVAFITLEIEKLRQLQGKSE
ncbi:MAG: hypothetical protein K0R15_2422 [Clostridiales bacterium]|jgi:transcriptional regulatory protein LevR|nr:hypothetical protein [Clostridiales bacterium]